MIFREAIEEYVTPYGYGIVRGSGWPWNRNSAHEGPQIPNYAQKEEASAYRRA